MSRAEGRGRGEEGLGVYRHLTPSRLCTQGEGGRGGLGGLGVYRHLTQGRLSTQGLRSVASRVHGSGFRVWASGFRLRPLEWAGQVARAERLRDVAGTRRLKRQTPHPLALPHIKTEK